MSVNGQNAVYLNVLRTPDGNTLKIVNAVTAAIKRMANLPPGLRVVPIFDQSTFVRSSYHGLKKEILQALVLIAMVILLFLQNLRGTFIVSVAIPLSFAITLIVLYAAGETLNAFTLGGPHPGHGAAGGRCRGDPRIHPPPSKAGAGQLSGGLGRSQRGGPAGPGLHRHHPCRVPPRDAPGGSGQETLCSTCPDGRRGHGGVLLRQSGRDTGGLPLPHRTYPSGPVGRPPGSIISGTADAYTSALARVLDYRWVVVGASAVLIVFSVALSFRLPSTFFPEIDEGMERIYVRVAPGTSLRMPRNASTRWPRLSRPNWVMTWIWCSPTSECPIRPGAR